MEPSARPFISCWKNQSNPFLWIHRLQELEFTSLDLKNHGGLCRIALFVNCNFAGDSVEIFGGGKSIPHLCAVARTGSFHRVSQYHCRIVAECSHGIRRLALITLLVGCDEVLHFVSRDLGCVMSREVMTFNRVLPDFYKLIGFPAV